MAGNVRQPIDISALSEYVRENVPLIKLPISLKQFSHGQSNPTYEVTSSVGSRFVLRKKPPGSSLSKSAHRIEREYQVIQALEHTDVPVPKTYCFCEDPSVIGSPFYIMEFLDGRIFEDPWLPDLTSAERTTIWKEAVRTLRKVHSVHLSDIGLGGWKKPASFYSRQLKSLGRVSDAQARTIHPSTGQEVGQLPHYDELVSFFATQRFQPADRRTLVHGDFKLDNLVFHKTKPEVIGILDWEMATEGHALSDLVNLTSPFLWTAGQVPLLTELALTDDLKELQAKCSAGDIPGLPGFDQCRVWYKDGAGSDIGGQEDIDWAVAFSNFRTAVVMQGIAARFVNGQASGVKAKEFASQTVPYALWAQARVQMIKQKREQPLGKL
ncbi:kinase-like domain-containing protein [Phialemonium atrogriseum]|uniref:Kinase-like domain-containing protein n=1 Tax=Phialemonium atrogriseum TaxID=1093897 RepID=A0AAJ0BVR5_9PEZI|nr:kinase-like domain-containing protein [Phialemonium atrogriseum]KAK1763984.1 kinase-like domain-containing protein [Phialemonium atrogriseum]